MSLRPETIQQPAEVRRIERAKTVTLRHDRTRRIFKATGLPAEDRYAIRTRNGTHQRVISALALMGAFTQVVPCGRCGGHHDLHRPRVH